MPSLFGFAPGGVCRAIAVTSNAVRSCRTVSPLLCRSMSGMISVALSLELLPPGVTRHRSSLEPGLSSPARFTPKRKQRSGGHPTLWLFTDSRSAFIFQEQAP
jgi:hypothetical protein